MADRIKNYQQEADQITTLKAIRTDFGVSPSSYTPDSTVVTKDRVVTFAQAEEELVVLSDIEKGVKQQIVDVDIAQKDISNIKALLQGNLYDYQTDSTSAYTKTVPSGAMPYAGLEQIGGKTIVLNQFAKAIANTTWGGGGQAGTVTFSDGECSYSPTGSNGSYLSPTPANYIYLKAGHRYVFSAECYVTGGGKIQLLCGKTTNTYATTESVAPASWTRIALIADVTQDNTVVQLRQNEYNAGMVVHWRNPQMFDLTLMFGIGSEPSTVADFEAILPAYYAYNEGTLLSAGVTSVVSKDSSDNTLQTYSIPASVQALTGYGWSAGSVYNEIDFERKVFIQRVGTITLDGTQNWGYESLNNVAYTDVSNLFVIGSSTEGRKWTLNNNSDMLDSSWYDKANVSSCIGNYYGTAKLFSKNPAITDGATAKSYFTAHPTVVNYALQTPVETDISAYLTDDNLIQVESGGTLTFPNSNGDDYRLPVPSEEEYMIDLQEAINNG